MILFAGSVDKERTVILRYSLADMILEDFEMHDFIFGQTPLEYVKSMKNQDAWGSEQEIKMFSKHHKVVVYHVDCCSGQMKM